MDSTKTTQTSPANTSVDSNNSSELQLDVRRARTIRTGIKAGVIATLDRPGRTTAE